MCVRACGRSRNRCFCSCRRSRYPLGHVGTCRGKCPHFHRLPCSVVRGYSVQGEESHPIMFPQPQREFDQNCVMHPAERKQNLQRLQRELKHLKEEPVPGVHATVRMRRLRCMAIGRDSFPCSSCRPVRIAAVVERSACACSTFLTADIAVVVRLLLLRLTCSSLILLVRGGCTGLRFSSAAVELPLMTKNYQLCCVCACRTNAAQTHVSSTTCCGRGSGSLPLVLTSRTALLARYSSVNCSLTQFMCVAAVASQHA